MTNGCLFYCVENNFETESGYECVEFSNVYNALSQYVFHICDIPVENIFI